LCSLHIFVDFWYNITCSMIDLSFFWGAQIIIMCVGSRLHSLHSPTFQVQKDFEGIRHTKKIIIINCTPFPKILVLLVFFPTSFFLTLFSEMMFDIVIFFRILFYFFNIIYLHKALSLSLSLYVKDNIVFY
jgi:hypothetical protein